MSTAVPAQFRTDRTLAARYYGIISNHSKALGPFLFRRSGPLFDLAVPGVAIR
jgi:hypothetical protein